MFFGLYFVCHCLIQKGVPGQPMALTPSWKTLLAFFSFSLAWANSIWIIILALHFHDLRPLVGKACLERYTPAECASVDPGWRNTCLEYAIPGVFGFAIVFTSVSLSNRVVGIPGLLYHPMKVTLGQILLLITILACTPLSFPKVFFSNLTFQAWRMPICG